MTKTFRHCAKRTHINKHGAEHHADELEKTLGVRPNVYKCKVCGYWHVGYTRELREQFSDKARQIYKRAHR